ncbi:MAG: aminotransferase class V-fold PLP-dependent enzyme [Melioribacteraceae bacterium]|nr:aminotransferase class V-fold PLP-dependent enzyme [Melioribacteraceae bacterium]
MTKNEVRQLFPHLQTGKIYFNHASIGPLASPIVQKLNDYLFERSVSPIKNFNTFVRASIGAKELLGKLINANPKRIAWVDNVSNGLNVLAQGLEWKAGDRIILNDLEFPSNVYPFQNLKSYGVEIDFVKSRDGKILLEDLEKAITPKTKMLSISAVQFLSGFRAELKSIGELCRKYNIIFAVDAIQAVSAVNIDVEEMKIDFLAGGSQKWLMALQGLSYIYLTEELQNRINQKHLGWLSVKNPFDMLNYEQDLNDNADRFQNGTMNAIGITALYESLKLFNSFGFENLENSVIENSVYLIEKLNELGITPFVNSDDKNILSGIVSFKTENSQQLFEELNDQNILGELREGYIRFSPHYYNTKEEIDIAVRTLKILL